jgi:predicted MFS family arabinose efflux permease
MRTFRSLSNRNYRLYFIGQLISLAGSWTQMTALIWLAQEMTGLAKWPAILIAAQIGPTVILGPWGGSLADRFPRRALISVTQIGFMVCACSLLFLQLIGYLSIGAMLAIMLTHGILQAIDLPARLAFVPTLVERDDLANAVALNSLLFNLARAVGPAFAGFLLAIEMIEWCFAVNAMSYLGVLLALGAMRNVPVDPPSSRAGAKGGFAILHANPRLGMLVVVAGLAAVGGWPLLSLLPTFAVAALNAGKASYSALLSSVGIGALIAALIAATISSERSRRHSIRIGLIVVVCSLLAMANVGTKPEAIAACICFGFGMILFFATGQSIVQLGIDNADRGKVMGVWAMVLSASVPMGNIVCGPLADAIGVRPVIAAQAATIALAVLLTLVRKIG